MTDLRTRMQIYDQAPVPELWAEVTARVPATSTRAPGRTSRSRMWIALAAAALTVVVGGAVLIGAGLIELPVLPEPVPAPSTSAVPSERQSPAPTLPPLEPLSGTWTATGPMVNTYVEDFTATLLPDGSVLVAGGVSEEFEAGRTYNRAEIFDPTSMSWTAADDMIEGRFGNAAVLMPDGRTVLVAGGQDPPYTGERLSSVESFDLVRMDWRQSPGMIGSRAEHQAVVLLDGRVLVAGGWDPTAEVFDPDPGVQTWTRTGDMMPFNGRVESATLLADGRVLIVGGGIPQLFDPASGTWSFTEPMAWRPYFRAQTGGHTATRLLDGRVLVAGGGYCCRMANVAELFDPISNSWSETGSMADGRANFAATLLPDGRVLVTGGGGDYGLEGHSTAEVFDPESDTWTAVPDMLSVHAWHRAVALADGRVLVLGGFGNGPRTEPGAEVYDPFGGQ